MTIWLFCIIIYLRWPLLSYWNTSSSFSQVRKKTEIIWCLCKVWKKFIFQDELKQMISPKKWLADLREKIKLLRNLLLSCAEGTTQVILLESTSFSSKSRHYLSENLFKLWMDYFFFLPISMFT